MPNLSKVVRRLSASAAVFIICTTVNTFLMFPRACAAETLEFLEKGNTTWSTSASYVGMLGEEKANVGSGQLGFNYFFRDNFSIGAELSGLYIDQSEDDTGAVSLAGVVRHHFLRGGWGTTYADFGFGPYEALNDTPPGGTRFNFLTRVGLGFTTPIGESVHFMVGARWWHLSNAQIEGAEHNPNFNGIETYFGLIWMR